MAREALEENERGETLPLDDLRRGVAYAALLDLST
jgi:hypothetical protein